MSNTISARLLTTILILYPTLAPDSFGQTPPPNTVPLHRFWSPELEDNMTVSWVPAVLDTILGRPRGFPDKYSDRSVEGLIFTPDPKIPQPKGTVPLYEWFSPSRTDSTTQAWRNTGRPDNTVQLQPDYTMPILLGYVFDPALPQPKGTVPLISWWSDQRKDYHTTTMPAWRGSYGEWREPDYVDPRLEGYMFPPAGMAPAPMPSVEHKDVTITLDRVVVHDDCDEVSPGDWFIGIAALNPGDPRNIRRARFPSSGSARNVHTGETVPVGASITLPQVAVTNDIRVVIEAIDCDRDSPLEAVLLFPFSLYTELDRRGGDFTGLLQGSRHEGLCHGEEEFHEVSGRDDTVGRADRIITPAE